jgi:hypothetical protein
MQKPRIQLSGSQTRHRAAGTASLLVLRGWRRLLLAAWLLFAQAVALAHGDGHEPTLDGKGCTICVVDHTVLSAADVQVDNSVLLQLGCTLAPLSTTTRPVSAPSFLYRTRAPPFHSR